MKYYRGVKQEFLIAGVATFIAGGLILGAEMFVDYWTIPTIVDAIFKILEYLKYYNYSVAFL